MCSQWWCAEGSIQQSDWMILGQRVPSSELLGVKSHTLWGIERCSDQRGAQASTPASFHKRYPYTLKHDVIAFLCRMLTKDLITHWTVLIYTCFWKKVTTPTTLLMIGHAHHAANARPRPPCCKLLEEPHLCLWCQTDGGLGKWSYRLS